ncbi:hypothetical protein DFH05DRAFT_1247196 [Lentinula detonsa]|uniref:LysM domain-containing protein n=1 Tax=Lentinula detonsa TaxID=2804962 RepID=A0A9W8NZP4_9AGAR|nr:hypothetical protein DFH05DRAFT_1247196 [Lentinula detonsa]
MFARISLFALVTALGAIMGANVYAQTSCQATYTVVFGDNCVAIAAKFNVSDAALLAANPVSQAVDSNCDNLFVGQQLCIPTAPASCQAEYTVKSGDVCISIANMFNITAAQLEAANSDIDPLCDNLQPGEVSVKRIIYKRPLQLLIRLRFCVFLRQALESRSDLCSSRVERNHV